MALVKFYNGNTENLDNLPIKEGQIIFSVSNSNGSIYYDSSNSSRIKMTALADRAIADNLGNNIGNTYINGLTGTTSKTNYVITPKTASGNNKTAITIPAASSTIAGLMTTETQSFSGNKTFNQTVTFLGSADASLGSYTYPAITIGPYSSTHLEIDANEIMAKANASTSSELYLNDEGGVVVIGPGGMNIRGHIIPNATTRTLDIGSTNNYFRNIYGTNFYGTATSATQLTTGNTGSISQPVYFSSGKPVPINNENFTLAFPNLDNTDMNQVAKMGNAMGMAYLETPEGVSEASYINPEGKTGWFHFINMSYLKQESNSWKTQIAVQTGTDNIYIRSRAGGTITNSAWKSNWTKMLTASNYSSIIDGRYVNVSGDTMTGELNIKAQNALRIIYGNYGVFFRNDGSNFYVLLTASGDQNGSWTSQRPLTINNSTGICSINGNAASATLLKPHNSNITYQSSNWNSTGSFVWGMSFKDSSLGGDSGDITLSLVKYSDTQNTLNLAIDGQINAGSVRTDRIGFIGNLQGNASTATKLQTARTINGTSFNGTANITTNIWGATRTLTIGHTAKSVNGSSNVSWSLNEIIQNSSIYPHKIAISDYYNYAQLNTSTASLYGWSSTLDENGVIYTKTGSMLRDISISIKYYCNGGETFEIKGQISSSIKGNSTSGGTDSVYKNSAVMLICSDGKNNNPGYIFSKRGVSSANAEWVDIHSYVTIPTNSKNFGVYIQTESYGNWSGTLKVRNIEVIKIPSVALALRTARTINGTAFDGTANITTTNWGSTRNFYIADASAAHTGSAVSVNGSSNVTLKLPSTITATLSGTASNAQWLIPNNNLTFGASGLQYFNLDGDGGTSPTANNTPTSAWYHILRMNHGNSAGYYADIAVPLNDTDGIYWRQIRYGTNYGWFKLLDSSNYTNYTVTKTGSGASGTWGINITGNAGTATKLQTARTVRTNLSSTSTASFNGTANITPGITGTLAITHGGTGATTASGACNNLGAVTISTSQTITGTKTFTANPVIQTTYYPSIILQPTNVTTVKGVIEASYVGSVFLDSYNSASGDYRRRLVINSTRSQSNIANALQLGDYKEGTDTRYMIYSQANLKYSSTEPSSPVSGMIWLKPV